MYQDQTATTTIRKIVSKIKSRGRISDADDMDLFQLVIDTMKELSLFTLPHKQIAKIMVDGLGRVALPKDYLMFLGVGVPKNGRFYTFSKDKSVVQSTDATYAYEAVDTTYGEGESPTKTCSYSYGGSGGLSETTFVINERRGFIQLTDFIGTESTLYYVSSGISDSPDGVTIPLVAEEAVIAGVLWKYVAYDPNTNMSGEADAIIYDNDIKGLRGVEIKSGYDYKFRSEVIGTPTRPGKPKYEHLLQTIIYVDYFKIPFTIVYIDRGNAARAEYDIT